MLFRSPSPARSPGTARWTCTETGSARARCGSSRLRRANKEIEALSFNNVLGRIAQILLDLANRYGKKTEEGLRIEMELSHKELAEMAGTAREVISRVISRFKRIGCIKFADNKIIITDHEKLKGWIF